MTKVFCDNCKVHLPDHADWGGAHFIAGRSEARMAYWTGEKLYRLSWDTLCPACTLKVVDALRHALGQKTFREEDAFMVDKMIEASQKKGQE